MLVTSRIALHYVRPDNYHVFMYSSMELDMRLVEIFRDSFVLLRAYSL